MKIKLTIDCGLDEVVQINDLYKVNNSVPINIGKFQFITSVKDVFTEDLPWGRKIPKTGSIISAKFIIEGYGKESSPDRLVTKCEGLKSRKGKCVSDSCLDCCK